METDKKNQYKAISAIHPFDILEDEIAARGLTKKKFAESIGMKSSNFCRMIKTKGALTPEMALRLEGALGIPYNHWMKFQEGYVKDCARLNITSSEQSVSQESSQSVKIYSYDDLFQKVSAAIRPIRERIDKINAIISSKDFDNHGNVSKEQILTIENDIHLLGKALSELRLS